MLTNLFPWLFKGCFPRWGQLFGYIISLLSWLRVKAEEKSSDINRSSSMPRGCHQPAHCNLIKMGKERIVCVLDSVCVWVDVECRGLQGWARTPGFLRGTVLGMRCQSDREGLFALYFLIKAVLVGPLESTHAALLCLAVFNVFYLYCQLSEM